MIIQNRISNILTQGLFVKSSLQDLHVYSIGYSVVEISRSDILWVAD